MKGLKDTAVVLVSIAAVALSLSACSQGESSSPSPNTTAAATGSQVVPGSSVIIVGSYAGNYTVNNLNPYNLTGDNQSPVQGGIYEPLFYYNPVSDAAPRPMLGTSFSWNSDGTVLTVKIRQGVKFNDGSPMTVDDVVFSLNLVSNNKSLNTLGQVWKTAKVDDQTVTLTFPKPAFTLEVQVLGREPIVPQAIWKSVSDPTSGTNEQPVGTGPYMMQDYTPEAFTMIVNPYYWGTGDQAPAIQYARFITLANADAMTTAYQQDKVDWMSAYLPTLQSLVDSSGGKLYYVNTPTTTTGLFACSNPKLGCTGPQTDPAVRQAMYYAIDRTQLSKQAVAGFAKPASPTLLLNWINQKQITNPDYMEVPQTSDVAKATSLLEAAGYTKGSGGYYEKDGKTLQVEVNDVSGWTDYNTMCQLLVGMFKAAGIKLVVNDESWNTWSAAEYSGKYELSLDAVNMGPSPDPYGIYQPTLSSSATAKVGSPASTNLTRFSDPQVDQAIVTLATTDDDATKTAQYATIQDALVQQMPIIPIYVNQGLTEFSTTRVTGWPTDSNMYAFPGAYNGNWGTGLIMAALRPVSK